MATPRTDDEIAALNRKARELASGRRPAGESRAWESAGDACRLALEALSRAEHHATDARSCLRCLNDRDALDFAEQLVEASNEALAALKALRGGRS